ncbi:TPA: TetR/AcrR family transcriptional regulator [Burkholderia cenocepacia]|nr:TetR/AcrR family transcriptional regulator [Burkholderia cenocepacia]
MGRVSREQAELNRERVVETACRLFRERGVENVSIADIMAEVGLTSGGFYKQFESKEALIDEAFSLAFKQSSGSWTRVRKRNDTGTANGLIGLVRHYFKRRPPEENCPMVTFASFVSNLQSNGQTNDLYGNGTEAHFQQFRDEALKSAERSGTKKLSEADAMVLFAAMIGTGLLTRALGQTPWTRSMQSAVIGAIPQSEAHETETV